MEWLSLLEQLQYFQVYLHSAFLPDLLFYCFSFFKSLSSQLLLLLTTEGDTLAGSLLS